MSRVDYVVVIQWWWWCVLDADGVLGVAVGGVVVLFLVDCGFNRASFTTVMLLYLVLCLGCVTPECMHMVMLWLPCPSRLAWDISTRALGDKIKLRMIIYSGVLFLNATWQMLPWQTCCFFYLFAGAKIRREEKKERKKTLSFF
jgi:sulfite exporter TauE/SafE